MGDNHRRYSSIRNALKQMYPEATGQAAKAVNTLANIWPVFPHRNTKMPRRMNSTNLFTSKGDDFDNLVLSLASFPPVSIIFRDPLSQIRASEFFSGRFKQIQRVGT